MSISLQSPTSDEAWGVLARQLALDLEDAKRAAAWHPAVQLDLLGWSAAGQHGRFYLVGSVLSWVELAQAQLPVPALEHMPLALGQPLASLRLERRPLTLASYQQSVSRDWPFRVEGPTQAVRVSLGGTGFGRSELNGLCTLLTAAVRRGQWEVRQIPDDACAQLDGDAVVLPHLGLRAGALLEVVYVWAQVFWAEVEWVRWTK